MFVHIVTILVTVDGGGGVGLMIKFIGLFDTERD
jgi:hypothetical protein